MKGCLNSENRVFLFSKTVRQNLNINNMYIEKSIFSWLQVIFFQKLIDQLIIYEFP